VAHPVNAYAAVGGHPGLGRVVERFADRVLGDPAIAAYFRTADVRTWRNQQMDLLAAAIGGPQRNTAAIAAAPPAAQTLTDADFDRLLDHLRAALVDAGTGEEGIRKVVAAASATRDLIVIPRADTIPSTWKGHIQ
jgi:hemoglobin